jgi:hypothetical protein
LKITDLKGGLGSGAPATIALRAFLHELLPTEISFFSTERVGAGESVAISLDGPKKFFVKGKVTLCMEVPTGGPILTLPKFSYRLRVLFQFSSEEERLEVERYSHELRGTNAQAPLSAEEQPPQPSSPESPAAAEAQPAVGAEIPPKETSDAA